MQKLNELLILLTLAVATQAIYKQSVYWAELGREQAVVDNINQELNNKYDFIIPEKKKTTKGV